MDARTGALICQVIVKKAKFRYNSVYETFDKYRGGKSKEIPNIEKKIPQFTGRYIEPFFGGGALYFHLEPQKAIINDINSKLIGFYNGVKSDYSNLRRELDEVEKIYEENRHDFDEL